LLCLSRKRFLSRQAGKVDENGIKTRLAKRNCIGRSNRITF
jgi:hypothetical protein